jgi:hypothetical protein
MAFQKYNESNLVGAPARVLYTPFTTTLPTNFTDIIDGVEPYAPKTNWLDFGATSGPSVIGRNLTTAGFQIQQTTTTLLEEPTDLTRTLTVPIAEFAPAILALLEESTVSTFAAATGRAGGSKIPFGTINSLSSFRIALIAQQSKQQGVNTEPGGATRGAFVAWVSYKASLLGDNLQTSIARGTLADLSVQFKVYPDPTQTTPGAEAGFWIRENSGATLT